MGRKAKRSEELAMMEDTIPTEEREAIDSGAEKFEGDLTRLEDSGETPLDEVAKDVELQRPELTVKVAKALENYNRTGDVRFLVQAERLIQRERERR